MSDLLLSVLIGAVSGLLSGAFGIGGAIITTPAIALLLGAPALVAVGTPLPVILPSAVTGALTYARHGHVDLRAGLVLGAVGSAASVVGALLTEQVGGPIVLLGTAVLILWAAVDTLLQLRPRASDAPAPAERIAPPRLRVPALLGTGLAAGFYAGFFGLGGGFVLVPMLVRFGRYPLKRAIATSLVAVACLSVPGTIAHAALGHIDWTMAAGLTAGVIPGALLGARVTLGAGERAIRVAFAALLMVAGGLLAWQQAGAL